MVRWSKGGRHEGLGMLWLTMRFGTTAPCSPASLVRISVTMTGLEQLQLTPEHFWPCKLFKSRISMNTYEVSPTTLSVKVYG